MLMTVEHVITVLWKRSIMLTLMWRSACLGSVMWRDCLLLSDVVLCGFREWLCRRKRLRIDWPARDRVSLSWPDRDRPPAPAGRIRATCSPPQPGRTSCAAYRHGYPHHSSIVANQDTCLHPNSSFLRLILWTDVWYLTELFCVHSPVCFHSFSLFSRRDAAPLNLNPIYI